MRFHGMQAWRRRTLNLIPPTLLQAVTEIHNHVTKRQHVQKIINSLFENTSHTLHNNQNYYYYYICLLTSCFNRLTANYKTSNNK